MSLVKTLCCLTFPPRDVSSFNLLLLAATLFFLILLIWDGSILQVFLVLLQVSSSPLTMSLLLLDSPIMFPFASQFHQD